VFTTPEIIQKKTTAGKGAVRKAPPKKKQPPVVDLPKADSDDSVSAAKKTTKKVTKKVTKKGGNKENAAREKEDSDSDDLFKEPRRIVAPAKQRGKCLSLKRMRNKAPSPQKEASPQKVKSANIKDLLIKAGASCSRTLAPLLSSSAEAPNNNSNSVGSSPAAKKHRSAGKPLSPVVRVLDVDERSVTPPPPPAAAKNMPLAVGMPLPAPADTAPPHPAPAPEPPQRAPDAEAAPVAPPLSPLPTAEMLLAAPPVAPYFMYNDDGTIMVKLRTYITLTYNNL
jgi:hypothetical protein